MLPGQSSVRRARAVPHWLPGGTPIADRKVSKEFVASGGRVAVNIVWTVLAERIGFGGVFPTRINVG